MGELLEDPVDGVFTLFLRRMAQDLIKLLGRQRTLVVTEELKGGRFVWPQAVAARLALTRARLLMLLEDIDRRQPQRTWEPQATG